MNFCAEHWQALRTVISSLGLDHLIAQDGESAAKRLVDQRPENFDPLLCGWQMVVGNALRIGEFGCLLCWEVRHRENEACPPESPCVAKQGILNLVLRDVRAEAVALGYTPRALS